MKRIYLDQNKWIDLTKAAVNNAGGMRYKNVLIMAREGVKRGLLIFPLSNAHYLEIAHIGSYRQRCQLVEVMEELSDFTTIAAIDKIIPGEIDQALLKLFPDVHIQPRPIKPFGEGVVNAFLNLEADSMLEFRKFGLERFIERDLLRSGAEGYRGDGETSIAANWASNKESFRKGTLQPDNWHKGERMERVSKVTSISDFQEPIVEALNRIGKSLDDFVATGADGMFNFVEEAPIINTMGVLDKLRHQASQKAWQANDLIDLIALSRAIVYCDIVVTEKLWTALIHRTDLTSRYSTVVISKLEQLTEHVVG